MKKYSLIMSLMISFLFFGALNAMASPGDFIFEFGDDYRFANPHGVAVDGGGNVYVADTSNNRIQVFTASGTFLRKWGDYGTGNGQFSYPGDIAVDGSGNVYVADTYNNRIQVFTDTGVFLRKWGAAGTGDSQFNTPNGVTVDGSGNVYVADSSNHRIQVFTNAGVFLGKWGSAGAGDGQFNAPYDIAVDGGGDVYVADSGNHRIQVFTNAGVFLGKWGSAGAGDGQMRYPRSIAMDGSGNVYVLDSTNNRVQVFTNTGAFLRKWGAAGSGDGQFLSPYGIAADGSGNVYVADSSNNRIQAFTDTGAFLRKWGASGAAEGQFNTPYGVAADESGNVYVADTYNNRIQVFTDTGVFLRKWGAGGTGDGQFNTPNGVAVDGSGNVYVADTTNHRIQVFTASGAFLRQWGTFGTGVGQFKSPNGVAVDGSGNVYVADTSNHRIQAFTGTGTFLAVWGTLGSGDGQFSSPRGVAVNGSDIYIADTSNNRIQVFTGTGGVFLMKWGTAGTGAGQMRYPHSLAPDGLGNIYVVDANNHRVQLFTDTGTFVRQWGVYGSGQGQFKYPRGIAATGNGDVYVADSNNHRIQVFEGLTYTDSAAPVTSISLSGTSGNNGWHISDVQVSLTAIDTAGGSGINNTKYSFDNANWNTYTAPFTISTEGMTTVYYGSIDNAGNIETAKSQTIQIDKTSPTISGSASPAPNTGGWNNTDVTVSFTGTDAVSGIDTCTNITLNNDGTGQSAGGTCTDRAGNISVTDAVSGINIDKTPPAISTEALPAPNANGWNNTDVTVSFTGTDALSGIDTCTGAATLINEGADQSAGGTCTDKAGNVSVTPFTVNIDKTPPVISGSALPAPNSYGWNNTDATVSFNGTDALSGIDSCTGAATLINEGADQSAGGTCTDKAGNISETTLTLNIDKTSPTISGSALPVPNAYGWNNTDVTVSFTGFDALSGIDSCTNVTLSNDGADQSAGGTCTDKAGNSSVTAAVSSINIDKTPPAISDEALPAPNAYGWNNTDVAVSFTGTDAMSGIDTCTSTLILSNDGADQPAGGTCTDKAGNFSVTPLTVNIDKTPPTVSASASPAPNANGWNNRAVTVNFTGMDVLSGIDACTNAVILSNDGVGQSASGTCTDKAGNSATATISGINIDKTLSSPGDFIFEFGDDYRFMNPRGVAVDGSGNVYVADTNNHRIQVYTATGTFLRKWGTAGSGDRQFSYPGDIAVDGSGNVYVADTFNNRIQVFTATGTFLRKWGTKGSGDGQFNTPNGVVVDGSGNVYVADSTNHRIQVFTGTGTFLRKWGTIGTGDGQFNTPYDIAVDGSGNVYVADSTNHRIQVFTGTGTFLRKWGTSGSGDGQMRYPHSVALDGSGNVYVVDTSNNRIQVFTGTGTFLRKWGTSGSGDEQFLSPYGITVDGSGNVYVADTSNHRIQVFTATGTFVRKWGASGSADGQFNTPYGIAVDGSGNVYVADSINNRVQVFADTGAFLRKWGTAGAADGQFLTPYGIAVDGSGNVYVADTSNHRIQVFTATGTFVRQWGSFGTGSGQLKSPGGVAVDGSGNVYVADTSNHRIQVFTSTGTFVAVWGVLGSGDGQFSSPRGVAVDGSGHVYVADTSNNRIQIFTTTGTFVRKWGTTGSGNGQFSYPHSVALDGSGNVYVADSNNYRIQVFTTTGTFVRKWGDYGSGEGQFKYPRGIAADGNGDVYVADTNNHRIQVFEGEGGTGPVLTDTAAPATTISLSGTSGHNGWHISDVQVSLAATDEVDGSGINKTEYGFDGANWNTYTAPFTISAEGMTIVYYRSIDNAGNIETAKSQTIKIDKTPPTVSASASPAPNAYGWNNTNVTVNFTGTDALSGIDTCTNATLSSDGAGQSAGGTCTDKAGNVSVTDAVSGINIDKTPPVISGSALPAPNAYGWNNTDVTVSFNGTDALSGIDSCTGAATLLSVEGANQSAGGTCTDKAGNVSVTATISGINIDKTPPVISGSALPAPNAYGWNNTNVTVSFNGTDALSGIDSCTGAVTLSNEGANQSAGGTCTDKAGNTTDTAAVSGINIDKTSPTISGSALPAPNAYGWNNTNVTVSFTGTDLLSGIDSCTSAVTLGNEGANQSAGGACTDKAGNVSVTDAVSGINIDKTPPAILTDAVPAPNAFGWNNTDVTVSFSGTDALSGIDSCTSSVILISEGADQPAGGACTDRAGNTGEAALAINIDKTAPAVSGSALPAPNANGWNDTDITVSFTGTDALSGIDTCTDAITLSNEGSGQSASGACTDKAGNNSETATVSGINIDKPSPTGAPGSGMPVANAGDDITIQSSQVGSTTVQGTATDAVTCRWTETDVTGNILSVLLAWAPAGPNGACPLNLSALSLHIGVHFLTLEASDGPATSLDNMTLTITNSVPNVDAGNDLTVTTTVEAAATVIQGSATDFDGNNLSCRWMEGTTVLRDWTPAGPTGECPLDLSAHSLAMGTHTLTLEANDGPATSSDDMVLTINNTPPVANAGDDLTIPSNQVGSTTIQGTVTDVDYAYTFTCRWTETDETGNILSVLLAWEPTGPNGECPLNLSALSLGIGVHTLTLEANDGQTTSLDTMTLTIHNSVPNANAGNDLTVTAEEAAATVIQGSATDFDGNNLSCRWMEGTTVLRDWTPAGLNGECPLDLSALSLDMGTHTLTLTTGDELATSSDDMVLTINNTPPIADAGENITITSVLIEATTVHGGVTDFDGDTLSYRWTVDGTPQPDWIPGVPALSGIGVECPLDLSALTLGIGLHTLILEVNDGEATSSDEMLLTIDNSAPNAAPGGSGVYGIDTPVLLTGYISDFDGDLVHYVWTDGTSELCSGDIQSIAGGTPVVLPGCTVTGLGLGIHTMSLRVSDGLNLQETKNITVQLTDSSAPTLKPEANMYMLWPPNHKLVNIAIAANASDNSGSAVTLNATITSNEPAESSETGDIGPDWTEPVINQTTGMIYTQLRAERSGRGGGRTYTVTITATDTSDNVSTAKVNILVPHDKGK